MAQNKDQPTPKQEATKDDRRDSQRRSGTERRSDEARRHETKDVSRERRSSADRREAPHERRKVERRINEYVLKPEVLQFINAVNAFKTRNQKPFPTWTEIFEIFIELGYRKKQDS